MARQAEAERERRAKVIAAEGELQASAKLSQAANVMSAAPGSLQLRFLQTVVEIAAENNSTTLFPIPLDLFEPLLGRGRRAAAPSEALPQEEPGRLPPGEAGGLDAELLRRALEKIAAQ